MSQIPLSDIIGYLEGFAPLTLAEDWDNVGLLLGDRGAVISKGLTCLTVTPEVVAEAIGSNADLIVSHHPMPFQPLKKITSDSVTGQMVLQLCRHGIAVYSPHTAFDSTAGGINQMIADQIGLLKVDSLRSIGDDVEPPSPDQPVTGVGRHGMLPEPLTGDQLGQLLRDRFQLDTVKFCGDRERSFTQVGIACGSAGQFLTDANKLGCDAFITGETNFHTCLDALAKGIGLFLLGHYGSERFAVEILADQLSEEFPHLSFAPSSAESDPIQHL